MAKFIPGIVSQREFPHEDLTSNNARILAMMLSSEEFFSIGHNTAEGLFWFYKAGHIAMLEAGINLESSSRVAAFDHGIRTYETASLLIRPAMPELDIRAARVNLITVSQMDRDGLFDLIGEAEEGMASLPNTREVVSEVAEHAHSGMVSYAIAGAALARQLELYAIGPLE